jgi:hypothetical protein
MLIPRSEVLTEVLLKIQIFWDEMQCDWANSFWCFEGTTILQNVSNYLQLVTA